MHISIEGRRPAVAKKRKNIGVSCELRVNVITGLVTNIGETVFFAGASPHQGPNQPHSQRRQIRADTGFHRTILVVSKHIQSTASKGQWAMFGVGYRQF